MSDRPGRLEGKVAIVTGAGSSGPGVGNGKAASVLFAREGTKVLLVDIDADHAQETLELITAEGGEASVFQADVTNADHCRSMVESAVERYGRLDILDNNVGVILREKFADIDPEDWDRVMAINLKSMMLASQSAIPRMIESGGGSIINITSVAGIRAWSDAAYAASKAGIIGLTQTVAAEYGRYGIRANAIAPGAVYTPMVAWQLSDEAREIRRESTLLGTEGTAWDVAWAAVYLASDEARWVTGVLLPVDGGVTITSRYALPAR